jgi:sigma-B regulation protein RsbU (phosphoserine phosphatase)
MEDKNSELEANISRNLRGYMATVFENDMRSQLTNRRLSLEKAILVSPEDQYLSGLLKEVDAALSRLDSGTFGICETCHEAIESERLAADPLIRFCIDHLTPQQQRALEQDLELAVGIQSALLPPNDLHHGNWRTAYHFEPAGPVSGDYCDLITAMDGSFYFMLGDVSGKGVAAAMLMSHLHALFRALTSVEKSLEQMMELASRVFCESTLANQYATLVCGKADSLGNIEICNAGHLPSIVLQDNDHYYLDANGLPLGLFCSEKFSVNRVSLKKGEFLIIVTDGLSESQDPSGVELGIESFVEKVRRHPVKSASELVKLSIKEVADYRGGGPAGDDLTLMVIERSV